MIFKKEKWQHPNIIKMRKLPFYVISKMLRFVSFVGEIVSMKVKVIDLSLFVKMSKVELGDWQLVAIRELPVVVRPSGLACVAVAQGLRSGEGKCGRRHMTWWPIWKSYVTQDPWAWQ